MQGQILQQTDMMIMGQRISDLFRSFSGNEEKFHMPQFTQKSLTGKFITVERFGLEHEVEYAFVSDELEIFSIDGITDIENTFSETFIEAIEEKIYDYSFQTTDNTDDDEEYDNYFQNQE